MGLHQGSALSPLLLSIINDELAKETKCEIPMMWQYAETARLITWQLAL